MTALAPLESLYDVDRGSAVPLPLELGGLYGRLQFPPHPDRAYVIGNFVTTLDGVVSLDVPGQSGGGEISGFNQHDRMVMGLLRAVADAVIVGAGTLRAVPGHVWTAEYIYSVLRGAYQSLRASLGKTGPPLNVVVTGSGDLDPGLRVFQSGEVPVLIVTGRQGAERLREHRLPPSVQIAMVATGSAARLDARVILDAVSRARGRGSDVILVEGGPQLIGGFFAERRLDELFLTLAPQIAGRDTATERPGLVTGKVFAPERPLWGKLVGAKRGESHLFLRYAFESGE